MSGKIYFDNSATTPLCDEAKTAMLDAMERYGNPSSLHDFGLDAESIVFSARKAIMSALGLRCATRLDGRQVIFTASGTEADNLALTGAAYAKNFSSGKKIITSDSEHPAVLETLKSLECRGFEVIKIPTFHGIPDYEMIERAADRDTILASFMLVNNETGAVYDIKRISDIVKAANPDALMHTDCVQGFLKLRFTPKSLGADMITMSFHKVNGPKGVGALWVSPGVLKARKLSPVVFGGGQESGMRSGTENVIGIAGAGAAVKANFERLDANIAHENEVREYIIEALSDNERFPGVKLNLPECDKNMSEGIAKRVPSNAASHIISVRLPEIKSEVMLHSLSHAGIYVSSGSACSSNTGHGSYVLKAFGLTDREADSTIRISLGPQNTLEEADRFLSEFSKSLSALVRMVR